MTNTEKVKKGELKPRVYPVYHEKYIEKIKNIQQELGDLHFSIQNDINFKHSAPTQEELKEAYKHANQDLEYFISVIYSLQIDYSKNEPL